MWGLLPVLSVCLSAFALAWWLVCGWLAILSLACDLRTTSVPSDFFALGYPLAFLALDFSLALRVWAANLYQAPFLLLICNLPSLCVNDRVRQRCHVLDV